MHVSLQVVQSLKLLRTLARFSSCLVQNQHKQYKNEACLMHPFARLKKNFQKTDFSQYQLKHWSNIPSRSWNSNKSALMTSRAQWRVAREWPTVDMSLTDLSHAEVSSGANCNVIGNTEWEVSHNHSHCWTVDQNATVAFHDFFTVHSCKYKNATSTTTCTVHCFSLLIIQA